MHTLVIFIVLGIAADDIFVFIDAWRQSYCIKEIQDDTQKRLAYSFRRAARATAVTSSTTSVAFLANAFSPLMPVSSFGIYAAIIISVNYALVILIFPPLIIWYDKNLDGKWCICSKEVSKKHANVEVDESGEEKFGKIEMFFSGVWNLVVFRLRYIIVLAFLVWTVVAAIIASKLSPLTKEEQFLPDDHPAQDFFNKESYFLGSGANTLEVKLFWGVKEIDKSKTSIWDSGYIGEPVMEEKFDLSSAVAQKSLLEFCDKLPNLEFVENNKASCWTTEFRKYLKKFNLDMPVNDPNIFN